MASHFKTKQKAFCFVLKSFSKGSKNRLFREQAEKMHYEQLPDGRGPEVQPVAYRWHAPAACIMFMHQSANLGLRRLAGSRVIST